MNGAIGKLSSEELRGEMFCGSERNNGFVRYESLFSEGSGNLPQADCVDRQLRYLKIFQSLTASEASV